MRILILSSAIVAMTAQLAHADRYAVVDFNANGIIDEADYIGPKSVLDAAMVDKPAQYEWKETKRTITVPGKSNVVPVAKLAPDPADKRKYVNIGPYKGGKLGTLKITPATTRTIVDRKRVLVSPAEAGSTGAIVYPNPHGWYEATVPASLKGKRIYKPHVGSDGVITEAEQGKTSDSFTDERLASYDTNKDGKVTISEAIANLDPLLDPNEQELSEDYEGSNEIVTPESKNL